MSREGVHSALSTSGAWIASYSSDTAISIVSTTDPRRVTTIRLPEGIVKAALRQLLWFRNNNDDTHLGLVTTNGSTQATCLTVMDRTRGVVLYSVSCDNIPSISTNTPSSTTTDRSLNKEKSAAAQCIGVLAAPSSSLFYIVSLSQKALQDCPVVFYECDVATGRIQRKIKLGRYKYTGVDSMLREEEEDGDEWNHYGFAIIPARKGTPPANDAIALAVLNGGSHGEYHRLRGVQLSDGHKLYQRSVGSESPHSPRRLALCATENVSVIVHKARGALELFHTRTGQVVPSTGDAILKMNIPADCTWQMAASNQDVVFLLLQSERTKQLLQIRLVRSTTSDSGAVLYESYSMQCMYRIRWNDGDEGEVCDFPAKSHQGLFLHTHPTDGSIQLVAIQNHDTLRIQRIPLAPTSRATSTNPEDLVHLTIEAGNDLSSSARTLASEPAAAHVEPALTADAPSRKRKDPPTVLGPGQAGGEAPMIEDTPRLATEDDDETTDAPTVGERLQMLRQALEEESEDDEAPQLDDSEERTSFVVRHATTESLTQLVAQALQSADGTMLEQALQVRDLKVLRATCQTLTSEQVTGLWDAILHRMAQKPNRADPLVAWVTALLQSSHITQVQHLQPLQNLLAERLEVFPQLIQLEGRLESMLEF